MKQAYRKIRVVLLIALISVLAVLAWQQWARISTAVRAALDYGSRTVAGTDRNERRLLEFGWNTPSLQEIPEMIDEAQRPPFDGMVLDADSVRDERGLSWAIYDRERIPQAEFDGIGEIVADVEWGRYTDNFLRLNLFNDEIIDWHDQMSIDAAFANTEAWARLAQDLGFVGIFLDTEQYGNVSSFDYWQMPEQSQHSLGDYEQLSYQRGREFMQALNRGYPGLTVMLTFGLSTKYSAPPLYWLMNPFLEGMLDAADEGTVIVDGFENSYTYQGEFQFVMARGLITDYTPDTLVGNSQRYREVMQTGFGLWLDHTCGDRGLGCTGGYSPDTFEAAVKYAFKYTDRYVWVYSERVNWYTGDGISDEWQRVFEALGR